eukprot:1555023-Rhodomonas_salina.1
MPPEKVPAVASATSCSFTCSNLVSRTRFESERHDGSSNATDGPYAGMPAKVEDDRSEGRQGDSLQESRATAEEDNDL